MRQLLVVLLLAAPLARAATLPNTLTCGRVGEAGGLGAGDDLLRITVDTTAFPDAVCNDGTPAVFYFARHTREEDRHKWVIFLQGGGGCHSGQECAERWCSAGTNFGMDKMSTSLSKTSIRGAGILSPRAENRFGTWNRVLVYYCSSDNWSGTKSTTLTASNGTRPVEYDIHFRGSHIVDAVLDTLRKEVPKRRTRAVWFDGVPQPMPDLDEATHLLFAGSSAGGGGVRNNADRVAAKLRATNASLFYRVAIDASFNPAHRDAADIVPVEMWGSRLDQSCLDWHSADTEWMCGDGKHVMTNHISAPMFIRQDLQDSLLTGNFVEAGFGTAADFGTLVHQQLLALAWLPTTAEEPVVHAPGAFGPQCRDHESFTSNEAFFEVKVNGLTFHDLLWNWWTDAQPSVAIRDFAGVGPAPDCPR